MGVKGKVALITGSSAGIGKAIALAFAKKGINVALCGRNVNNLNAVKEQAEKYGVTALCIAGDLSDDNFALTLVDKVVNYFGGIDILVNNAGMTLNCKLEDTSVKDYDAVMKLNVKVPYFLCKTAIKYLRKSGWATIINIASVTGHFGYFSQSAYSASKHAVVGFTKALAKEVYKDDIRVHLISPGGVFTDMVAISRPDLTKDGMIMPEDIADIAVFMVENRTNAVIDEIAVHRMNKEPFM